MKWSYIPAKAEFLSAGSHWSLIKDLAVLQVTQYAGPLSNWVLFFLRRHEFTITRRVWLSWMQWKVSWKMGWVVFSLDKWPTRLSVGLLVWFSSAFLSVLFSFCLGFSHHLIPDVAKIKILSPPLVHCLNSSFSLVRSTVTLSGSGPSLLSKH